LLFPFVLEVLHSLRERWIEMNSAALSHHFLRVADRFCGIEAFRTYHGAVIDGMAAIAAERVFEAVQALAGVLIAAFGKPAAVLQQDRRTKILVLVPAVARAAAA
jgi:hypothetical protein